MQSVCKLTRNRDVPRMFQFEKASYSRHTCPICGAHTKSGKVVDIIEDLGSCLTRMTCGEHEWSEVFRRDDAGIYALSYAFVDLLEVKAYGLEVDW